MWVLLSGCFLWPFGDHDDSEFGAPIPPGEPSPGGHWEEPLWCSNLADLSGVESAHTDIRSTAVAISELRYPPATGFIDAQTDEELSIWISGDDYDDVLDGYEVAVHEGCHIWGFGSFGFGSYSYRIVDDDHIIETAWPDTFSRSAILDRHPDAEGDFYSDVYLTGASGDQGFHTLLDEFNAYTHSLASRMCTRDTLGGASTSARDGILTMMAYVGTYLAIAREEHPDDYDEIVGDAPTVQVILDVWDRAEFWLAQTESMPELGIDDDAIATWTYDPAVTGEIDRLR